MNRSAPAHSTHRVLESNESIWPRGRVEILLLVLATLTVAGLVMAATAQAQQCPSLVWQDEFSGSSVDTTKWEPMIGDGCTYGICGWGNNELQYYQAENATVSGGTLKIEARKERVRGKQYTSARLRTINQGDFTYGRMEARIKITTTQGIWPAFWMLSTDEIYGGWPQSGEIDIMENIGSEPKTVHGTIHYGPLYPDNKALSTTTKLSFDPGSTEILADDFHIYAVEREQDVIRMYLDDVLYATYTAADVSPEIWPFNERFHFLLNVAVGGNFPGAPDGTTVLPQVMEVDYVRVYDAGSPYLTGDRVVSNSESGVAYAVSGTTGGSSYTWSVPAGATIASGQGTSQVTVDWGDTSGNVTVDVTDSCGSRQLAIDVYVEPVYVPDVVFENYDDPANVTPTTVTGTLVEIANPDTSGINTSALSGEYARNPAEQYDLIAYDTSAVPDAGAYTDGTRRFVIDVYTAAPIGSTVLLQLEDSSSATPSNYPAGRHSRYQAVTTVQNDWERLELPLLDEPDPATGDNNVDTMILLLEPNSFTGDTYVLDNLDGYVVDGGGDPPGEDPTAVHVANITTGTQGAGQGQKYGTADVTIVDDLGGNVAGATVTVTFTGDINETVVGTTDGSGVASVTTTGTAGGNVQFTACVDNVVASLPYDSASNVQTCE